MKPEKLLELPQATLKPPVQHGNLLTKSSSSMSLLSKKAVTAGRPGAQRSRVNSLIDEEFGTELLTARQNALPLPSSIEALRRAVEEQRTGSAQVSDTASNSESQSSRQCGSEGAALVQSSAQTVVDQFRSIAQKMEKVAEFNLKTVSDVHRLRLLEEQGDKFNIHLLEAALRKLSK